VRDLGRWAALLAGVWAGIMLCIGAIAAPAGFALLAQADAGRVAGRMLAIEANLSLALVVLLYGIERWKRRTLPDAGPALGANTLLILGALFCTVAGHFAVQPMLVAARAGQGALSFGALHGVSVLFFVAKGLLVLALAWRLGAAGQLTRLPTSSGS
jgi:Domain of unknown function (DUF4149)